MTDHENYETIGACFQRATQIEKTSWKACFKKFWRLKKSGKTENIEVYQSRIPNCHSECATL